MKNNEKNYSLNLRKELQNDNVFIKSVVMELSELTSMPTRKGLEKAIVCEGQLVNVVSNAYGHLPNEKFFYEVEAKLIEAGIGYVTRSINRDNRSFAVDYILSDDTLVVKVKNDLDRIRPMLRFTNSYDGSGKTSGYFGFFREVCTNGLHVSQSKIGFNVKHRGDIAEIVIPEIRGLVGQFLNNEFYSLHRKFEVLAEKPIADLKDFVKVTAETFKLFQFESSDKNPEPSLNARLVIETIERESGLLGSAPTFWHGYNAFNALLHSKLKKTFDNQSRIDAQLFEHLVTL